MNMWDNSVNASRKHSVMTQSCITCSIARRTFRGTAHCYSGRAVLLHGITALVWVKLGCKKYCCQIVT